MSDLAGVRGNLTKWKNEIFVIFYYENTSLIAIVSLHEDDLRTGIIKITPERPSPMGI